MLPEVAAALDRLDRLAEATPSLRPAAALQGAILRAMCAPPPRVKEVDIPNERAAERLSDGVPLLRNERVPLSTAAIEARILGICQALRRHQDVAGPAGEIAAAIRGRALDVATLMDAVLGGQVASARARAGALGLPADLLGIVLRFGMFPELERVAAQLAPLREATPWRQGYCPTCGSWPLLGEYRGLDQARFLRCGLCASAWATDRLLCPFCGSRDHADLGYLHVEGEEHRRAATCERCRGYVKMLMALTPIPPLELAVYDLDTIHLDMVALERGYAAPV